MKIRYIILMTQLLFSTVVYSQVNYYVSESGSDQNDGLTTNTPWKTIDKVNAMAATFQAGDSILFSRGDVFRGEILPQQSGTSAAMISYSAYGTGATPVINGASVITNWTVHNGNVWVADYQGSLSSMNNFFINNKSSQIGRYPNADAVNQGYLRIQGGSGSTVLTDNSQVGKDWTGATAVVRVNLFLLNKPVVQSHVGSTLTFAAPGIGNYTVNAGYGYFLQNHIATLDQQGEWYFDKTARKLFLYSETDPNNLITEAPASNNCFSASGKSYLNIENLAFKNANEYGVKIDSTAGFLTRNITIRKCIFTNSHNALLVNRGLQIAVLDNEFRSTNNNAIFLTARESVCSRNKIINTALRAGMGEPANNQYNAINLVGRDAIASDNYIDSVGYCGIRFEGTRLLIKHNQVSNFAMVKCDIGGIYTFKGFAPATYGYGNNRVTGNIVSKAQPNLFGTTSQVVNPNYAVGIYMDGNSAGNLVDSNTVYKLAGAGLLLNVTTSGHTVRSNTFFDNMVGFGYFPDAKSGSRNHRVTRNIFYSKSLNQQGGVVQTANQHNLPSIGTIDSNYYSNPFEKDADFVQTITTVPSPRVIRSLNLSRWRALSYDLHGVVSNIYQPPFTIQQTGSNRITVSNNSQFGTGLTTGSTAYTISPASGTNAPAWDNTGQLDGGSLRLAMDDTTITKSSRALINIGTLTQGKYYKLSFSAKGSVDSVQLQIALLAAATSNFGVTKFKSVTLGNSRKEVEMLLSPNFTNNNTVLSFALYDHQTRAWVDNIVFSELEVDENNPENYLRFEVNTDSVSRSVSLNGQQYTDVQGTEYSGTFLLPAFSSVILQKQPDSPLPVELTYFSAKMQYCYALLEWRTAAEKDVDHFLVEQSVDGRKYFTAGKLLPEAKTSNTYKTEISLLDGNNYFKLKIVDTDGSFAYSHIVSVRNNCAGSATVTLYPNPVGDFVNLKFPAAMPSHLPISIYDLNGKVVLQNPARSQTGENTMRLQVDSLIPGKYFIRSQTEKGTLIKAFVK
ncbi:Por secretion system C-terminal sorting domain-containing protein [Dyadobacter koreensis]|uniref:Por secretion system C-terminal sorting domain-containing protein n=1 Tax=Dyadobacter koreensis TaxID=408657 RepID=A0A1H6VEJ8_9BACT|nr:T9SS type A sorting domain-containing protein [Dyadobacter koreensis]SEJ03001.1 Por secretion system C-terminal sorting domain-containing protein [Dyadobacter koreensis]